jgi:hypothetical protein
MGSVIVDKAMQARLRELDKWPELRDESGRILGYFAPAHDPALYAGMASEEELE